MRSLIPVVAVALATALLFPTPASAAAADPRGKPGNISGRYLSTGDTTKAVGLKSLAPGIYLAVADDWEGVGFFDGATYWGVFRASRDADKRPRGTHRGTIRPDGSLAIHGELQGVASKGFDVVWAPDRTSAPPPESAPRTPRAESPDRVRVTPPEPDEPPELGEYVYVEELPEAVTKVPPDYPEVARAAKREGTVLIQALVGKDGRVADTRIAKSIPGLDEAAVHAVRQWVFKPALAAGKPVAVWVAVPVRFPPP